ncbi:MAG TPA: Transcriptional regulator MntR [Hyphomicrobiaceae bacterium MAG_BT-2024]
MLSKSTQGALNEDYVELIADLIDDKREIKAVDTTIRLGVTRPTVDKRLNRLQSERLIIKLLYKAIFFNETVRALSEDSRKRHNIVVSLSSVHWC